MILFLSFVTKIPIGDQNFSAQYSVFWLGDQNYAGDQNSKKIGDQSSEKSWWPKFQWQYSVHQQKRGGVKVRKILVLFGY